MSVKRLNTTQNLLAAQSITHFTVHFTITKGYVWGKRCEGEASPCAVVFEEFAVTISTLISEGKDMTCSSVIMLDIFQTNVASIWWRKWKPAR